MMAKVASQSGLLLQQDEAIRDLLQRFQASGSLSLDQTSTLASLRWNSHAGLRAAYNQYELDLDLADFADSLALIAQNAPKALAPPSRDPLESETNLDASDLALLRSFQEQLGGLAYVTFDQRKVEEALNLRKGSTEQQIAALLSAQRVLLSQSPVDPLQYLKGLNRALHSAAPDLPFDPEVVDELRSAFPLSSGPIYSQSQPARPSVGISSYFGSSQSAATESAVEMMDITVKTLTGKVIMLKVDLDAPIAFMKLSIQDQEGIPPEQQRLIWAGRQLEDDPFPRTLPSFGFPNVVHLVLRLRDAGNAPESERWAAMRQQFEQQKAIYSDPSRVKLVQATTAYGGSPVPSPAAPLQPRRSQHGTVVQACYGSVLPSAKIASFDMDGTLIEPRSGAKFPKNARDWKWKFPNVKSKLVQLASAGFKIVLFTNQKGLKDQRLDDILTKIGLLAVDLAVPIQAFVATADDDSRKPNDGMFRLFLTQNGEFSTLQKLTRVFFVGDAAGRKTAKKTQGGMKGQADFSDSDLGFANKVGIKFFNESEFFQSDAFDRWGK